MSQHAVCCGAMFWVYLMSCVGLVMFAGLMSGLTLGLMSLSLVDLEVLAKAGTPTDKDNAGTSSSLSLSAPP
jgi:metal transporter CNNM